MDAPAAPVPVCAEPLGPATPLPSLRLAGLALVFAVAGVAIAWLVISGRVPAWGAAMAHLSITGAAAWLARGAREPHRARALWLLAIGFGGLGAIGAAGTALGVVLGVYFDRRATPVDEWRRTLFPEAVADKDEALWALVGARQGDHRSTVAPFVDVLEHGSLAQKQAVVALVARHFRPAFAPALRLALRDPQNAVRVQAATAVSLIEAAATSRALDLQRQRGEHPDDPELLLELAHHEDQYAFTGLLDTVREQESRARAIAAFRAYLTARPGDLTAWYRLGRLFARLGEHEHALACLREVLDRGGTVEARLWIMECLFHLRRFDELRALARASEALMAAELPSLPVETGQVLRLWVPEAGGAR